MNVTLESIGISKDELAKRIVDKCADSIMHEQIGVNDAGEIEIGNSGFARAMRQRIVSEIDRRVAEIAEAKVLPMVAEMVENVSLQATNQWGEKKGAPVTFVEYLVQRADAYLREEVSFDGKVRGQDSYSWKAAGTRVAVMIHQHLHYSVETAMKNALAVANSSIIGGLEAAVKIKLKEIGDSLKVKVETR